MGVAAHALFAIAWLLAGAWLARGIGRWMHPATGPAEAPTAGHQRDRWLDAAGPALALLAPALALVVLPLGGGLVGADLGIGVFYFLVVLDFVVLGVAVGGWGAASGRSVEACYRAVAQLVAYVVPIGLAYVGAIMMAESLSTVSIVEAQARWWYVVLQPLGFALYVVTGLMQALRPPFSEPFAPEIGGGVLGAARGPQGLLWRLALDGLLFSVAGMGAVLYLGGWHGPWLPGPVWMVVKTAAMIALMLGVGRRLRRRSTAELLALAWRVLIPVGMANVLVVGVLVLLKVSGR